MRGKIRGLIGMLLCLSLLCALAATALSEDAALSAVGLMNRLADLELTDSALIEEMGGRLQSLPQPAQDAVSVTTFAQLKEAAEAGQDAIVTASFELEEPVTLTGSLWIAEGCELTTKAYELPEGVEPWEVSDMRLVLSGGCVLVNNGTVCARIEVGEGSTVYNGETGVMTPAAIHPEFEEDPKFDEIRLLFLSDGALAVNYGTLADRSVILDGALLVNAGSMQVHHTAVYGGTLVNLGEIVMPTLTKKEAWNRESYMPVRRGGEVVNRGTMMLMDKSHLYNMGWFVNDGGEVTLKNASVFENPGMVFNKSGHMQEGTKEPSGFYGTMMIGDGTIKRHKGNGALTLRWDGGEKGEENMLSVSDAQALSEAMQKGCDLQMDDKHHVDFATRMTGEIALDELTVSSALYVSGTLSVASLTVDGGYIVIEDGGSLTADAIDACRYHGHHGVQAIIEVREGGSLTAIQALQAEGASVFGMGGEIHLDGAQVELIDNCALIVRSAQALAMDGAQVLVGNDSVVFMPPRQRFTAQDASFTMTGHGKVYLLGDAELTRVSFSTEGKQCGVYLYGPSATLNGCTVSISEGSEIVAEECDVTLAEGTRLENDGDVQFASRFGQVYWPTLNGDASVVIRNNGKMDIGNDTELLAPIENQGSLTNWTDHALLIEGRPQDNEEYWLD